MSISNKIKSKKRFKSKKLDEKEKALLKIKQMMVFSDKRVKEKENNLQTFKGYKDRPYSIALISPKIDLSKFQVCFYNMKGKYQGSIDGVNEEKIKRKKEELYGKIGDKDKEALRNRIFGYVAVKIKDKKYFQEYQETYLNSIKNACKLFKENTKQGKNMNPLDIIVFPEMSFPCYWGRKKLSCDKQCCDKIKKNIIKVVRKERSTIFAGSSHCPELINNAYQIYYPRFNKRKKVDTVGQMNYYKHESAIKVSEYVNIPNGKRLLINNLDTYSFYLLLCVEAMDSATISRILSYNRTAPLTIVPSFVNHNNTYTRLCKCLSELIGNAVCYVNQYLDDASNGIYYRGKLIKHKSEEYKDGSYIKIYDNINLYEISHDIDDYRSKEGIIQELFDTRQAHCGSLPLETV